MAVQGSILGNEVLRLEDDTLLQGIDEYTDDLDDTGAGHVHFVRSSVASGTINSIDKSAAEGIASLRYALRQQGPGFPVLWLLALWAVLRPRLAGRRAWGILLGWLVASLAGTAVGLYFRPHYFIQALPALAALCGAVLGGQVLCGTALCGAVLSVDFSRFLEFCLSELGLGYTQKHCLR